MGDDKTTSKKDATKEYVVVFDQLDKHTGEFVSQGAGMPQLAVTESYFRGDKVSLTDADARRHLEVGAVIEASDKRAKLIKANPVRSGGVKRDLDTVVANAQELEETPAAVAGKGATRGKGGTLGTKAELAGMKVTELKALAGEHGVEVTRSDTKDKLVAKLAKVRTGTPDGEEGAGDQTVNPGQGDDQSPPPEDQPDEPPEE